MVKKHVWRAATLGAVSVVLFGCSPTGNTRMRPLQSAVHAIRPAVAGAPLGTVMVATLTPRAVVSTRSTLGLTLGAPRDDNGPGLARSVARLRVARKVVRSSLSGGTGTELLGTAKDSRASLLVTSQVVEVHLSRGVNAHYAGLLLCALTVGLTLVGIPACMAIPAHTLRAEVALELAIWDVAQGRRVWQRRVRQKGWVSVSSYTAKRGVLRAIARGTNVAYRVGLVHLARALVSRVTAKAQNSGVNR